MKKCQLGYIVMNYINPLIQMISIDIPEYKMNMITTKCLNTALMLIFLFVGEKGIEVTSECDVNNVVKRHQSKEERNS